jgi:hypothetical protein
MATKRQIKAAVEALSEALDIVMAAKSQTEHLSQTWQHLDALLKEEDRLTWLNSPNRRLNSEGRAAYRTVVIDLEHRLNGEGGAKDIYNHASDVWVARREALLALSRSE